MLYLGYCESLEALPDSITTLSQLHKLFMLECSSLSKLPTTFGLMTGLVRVSINLATEGQVIAIGELNALKDLTISRCIDKAMSILDSLGTLANLSQLFNLHFFICPAMTKLPETIGLLANLDRLELWGCEKVRKLPSSIGQLQVLKILRLRYCSSLEILPDSLGDLTNLEVLCIMNCASIPKLPTSIGHLSSLQDFFIHGCNALQTFPNSLNQLNKLVRLQILDCGRSLRELDLLRALQGLRIWGCTSINELPGSCLMVVDSNFESPAWIWDSEEVLWICRDVKARQEVEANDCGVLCHV